MRTPDLIDALVMSATPVHRLRPPGVRAALWLLMAAAILLLLAVAHGVRPDLSAKLYQQIFVVGMAFALATAVFAAIAAFRLSLADTSRWWMLLPAPALTLWVSTIGYGCLTDWVSIGPDGVRIGEAIRCFATLLLTSVPLSLAMLIMLRHAAALRPTAVSITGGLAVAALTSFALSLIHDLDATIMILVWNLGTAAIIAGLASAFGRGAFAWVGSRVFPSVPQSLIR
jgi:hypothetical protein